MEGRGVPPGDRDVAEERPRAALLAVSAAALEEGDELLRRDRASLEEQLREKDLAALLAPQARALHPRHAHLRRGSAAALDDELSEFKESVHDPPPLTVPLPTSPKLIRLQMLALKPFRARARLAVYASLVLATSGSSAGTAIGTVRLRRTGTVQ